MEITWQTSPEHRDEVIHLLEESGVEVRERRGFEPLTTIAVVAGVAALVTALSKSFRDVKLHGVIIDATRQPIEVREMPNWDRQQVLYLDASGPHFHEFSDEAELQTLLTTLMGARAG